MAYITLDELKKILPEIMSDWIDKDDESWEWIFQEIEQKCHIGKKKKGKKKQIEEKFENLLAEFDVYKKSTDGLQHENVQQGLSIKDIQAEVRRLRDDIKAAKSMAEIAKNRTQVDYTKYTGYTKGSEAQIIQNVYNRMVNRGATREELDNFKAVIKKYDATNYQPSNNFSYTDGKTAKEVKEIIDCMRCKHYCGDGVIKEPCIGCTDYDCWEAKNNG